MTETVVAPDPALIRLMTWLSPAFPVGAYTYSHGLEAAIEQGWVVDRDSLHSWIIDLFQHGTPRNDAIYINAVFKGDDIGELDALSRAFQPTKELKAESLGQGKAFLRAVRAIWPDPILDEYRELSYVIAVALAAKLSGIGHQAILQAYLHAFAANLVSAAVRAIPLGQTDGLNVLASIESHILNNSGSFAMLGLNDLGGCTLMNDFASMLHETQHTRLFRS